MPDHAERDKLILYAGGIAAAYFLVVRPIMSAVGISPEDQAKIEDQNTKEPAENAFSIQFQPFIDNFNANPSFNADGSKMDIATFYHTIKQWYDDKDPNLTGAFYNIANWAETINDSLSFWNWAGPHVDAILAVFAQMTNKQQVSSVANYLLYNYNKELLHLLRYGSGILPTIPNGLSGSQLALLIDQINNLPNE